MMNSEKLGRWSLRESHIFAEKMWQEPWGTQSQKMQLPHIARGAVKHRTPTNGGIQELLFIPEGDLYRLIVSSKLPTAEKFECWVFDEVLPSIRKHGGYISGQAEMSPEELMARALQVAQKTLEERGKNKLANGRKFSVDRRETDVATES